MKNFFALAFICLTFTSISRLHAQTPQGHLLQIHQIDFLKSVPWKPESKGTFLSLHTKRISVQDASLVTHSRHIVGHYTNTETRIAKLKNTHIFLPQQIKINDSYHLCFSITNIVKSCFALSPSDMQENSSIDLTFKKFPGTIATLHFSFSEARIEPVENAHDLNQNSALLFKINYIQLKEDSKSNLNEESLLYAIHPISERIPLAKIFAHSKLKQIEYTQKNRMLPRINFSTVIMKNQPLKVTVLKSAPHFHMDFGDMLDGVNHRPFTEFKINDLQNTGIIQNEIKKGFLTIYSHPAELNYSLYQISSCN